MQNLRLIFFVLFISAITFTACEEDDSTQPSTPVPTTNSGGGNGSSDTTSTPVDTTSKPTGDQFWLGNGVVKCTPFSKNFSQFINLLSVNTDKCYQEFVRPNFTFDFANSNFGAGTYNIIPNDSTSTVDTDVVFSMSGYNSKTYVGVSGTIMVSRSTSDSTKWSAEWDRINLYSETDSSNHTFTGRIEDF